jgi:hypothetical protein
VLAERKVAAALRKATLAPNTPARPHSEPHRPAARECETRQPGSPAIHSLLME